MFDNLDFSLVNWSRLQFAVTAMYHWLFVPLTLGLSFIIAFMETLYVRTGDEKWKQITKYWMRLFGINFAIGVATGLILEFQFGTNWSNYSWFVGDIFGAPLAIEGIMAFFMESTFIAVMFFGWNKVSKGFHLTATWLTAIGSNLSAVWILVANAWMQNPTGMHFNPDMARNEMTNFWAVFLSQTAVDKFMHTTMSSYILAAIFVIGISSWYLIKKREQLLAKRSIMIASIFGLLAVLFTIQTGDSSARDVAKVQPVKFAAMEGHFTGSEASPLILMGFVGDTETAYIDPAIDPAPVSPVKYRIEIPGLLSLMTTYELNSYIPGLNDYLYGNAKHSILSTEEKIIRGHEAQQKLLAYKQAMAEDSPTADTLRAYFQDTEWLASTFKYFGYGSYYNSDSALLKANITKVIPPIGLVFYSFHLMVALGFWFLLLFIVMLYFVFKDKLEHQRLWLYASLWSIPLAYISSEAGWIVNEVGRQPWTIQDLMTCSQSVTNLDSYSVMITCLLFGVVFTILLIAEIKIILRQISKGTKEGE